MTNSKKSKFLSILWKVVLAAAIVLLVCQQWLTQTYVTLSLGSLLGVPIEIENVHVDYWNSQGQLKGLQISNPDGFCVSVVAIR